MKMRAPASQRRSISRLSCTTEFTSDPLEFQRQIQRGLVLLRPLVVGVGQTELDETRVDSGTSCFFGRGHSGADCMPRKAFCARSIT